MISRIELLSYLETLLESNRFKDYCPNGLQVEGADTVEHIVAGVTASQALIDAAIAEGADTVLVHHGYFWRGEEQRVVSIKQKRLKSLLVNNINLIAYHLPLDAHPSLGNNAQLADVLGIDVDGRVAGTGEPALALYGRLKTPISVLALSDLLAQKLEREPLAIQAHDRPNQSIGWCTGAAQGYIEQAAALGLDAFISGEISEQTVHLARELGINYFAAGHHATERYGVKALAKDLANQFNIKQQFIDIDNPV